MADEVTIPTQDEIAALPRWARVAFAARCARRVLPLFKHHWPDAPKEHLDAVRKAVEVAEQSATTPTISANDASITVATVAASAAVAAYEAAHALAFNAASAAVRASTAAHSVRLKAFTLHDVDSTVARAAADEASDASPQSIPAIRHDFQRILDESRKGNWTDDTPVPPWVFGPMWPNGVPEGWPEADPQERLLVTVGVPEDAKPEQTADYLNRLHALLNQLNIENGGPGFTIDTVRREAPVEAPIPVGGGS